MDLRVDTHFFIWAVAEPRQLDKRIRAALVSPDNQILVSAITPWEIAIKRAAGRLEFPLGPFDSTVERMGLEILRSFGRMASRRARCPATIAIHSTGY